MKKRGPSSTQPRPTKPRWLWPAAIAAVVAAAAVTFWTTTNLNNKTKPAVFNGEGQSARADKKTPQTPNTLPPQEIKNQNSKIENQTPPPPPAAYQPRNVEPAPNIPAPGPITLAPSQLTIGSHADANPLDFAFHPSRFADPSHVANRIGIVTLELDPEPTTVTATKPAVFNGAGQTPSPTSQTPPQPATLTPYQKAVELERARAFAMSLTLDLQNNLWVGTEDGGVQKYDPSKPPLEAWTQFTTQDGLGDNNAYAIATDHQGRIWVGHLNHGVSVYNGQKWQTYETVAGLSHPGTLAGPLGERIFSIEVAPNVASASPPMFRDPLTEKLIPLSGSVWMCSSAGLAVYAPATDSWHYFTRADGLPSDQANALAFARDGTLYLATQCDGIAIASPSDHYATWKQIQGPDELPTTPTGAGLPTNLMNDILVAKDGTVYAATTAGLAFSKDKGTSWQFVRGADWAERVRRRPEGPPPGWIESKQQTFSEDYCTSLGQDASGELFVGHRSIGATRVDTNQSKFFTIGPGMDFVKAIGPTEAVATYGGGVFPLSNGAPQNPRSSALGVRALPQGAKVPNLEQLKAYFGRVKKLTDGAASGIGISEDWMTQGNWVGRFGRQLAVLHAAGAPRDHVFAKRPATYTYKPELLVKLDDAPRAWVQNAISLDRRSLYDPEIGIRRTASLDDHGEAYPRLSDAPGLAVNCSLPPGMHRVSIYFLNDNGHDGPNRKRDYVVSLERQNAAAEWQVAARMRVGDFYGGVYKQFAAMGPGTFRVTIARNGSHNSMCSGFFVDKLEGGSPPKGGEPLLWMADVRLGPGQPRGPNQFAQAPMSLFHRAIAEALDSSIQNISHLKSVRIQFLRAALLEKLPQTYLAEWKWELGIWGMEEERQFENQMRIAWSRMQQRNPILQNRDLRPFSPGIK